MTEHETMHMNYSDALEAEKRAAREMPMPTEMLPCPFCGAAQDLSDPDTVYPATRSREVWNARCTRHGTGCGAEMLGWSAADAVTNWNQRALPVTGRGFTEQQWPERCLQPDASDGACKCCQRWFSALNRATRCGCASFATCDEREGCARFPYTPLPAGTSEQKS